MECPHDLPFKEILTLDSHLSLSKPVNYTCPKCGQKCELTIKSEHKLLTVAVTILCLLIAIALVAGTVAKGKFFMTLLCFVLVAAVTVGVFAGMTYLQYRLGHYSFTALHYRSVVDRKRLSKRQ